MSFGIWSGEVLAFFFFSRIRTWEYTDPFWFSNRTEFFISADAAGDSRISRNGNEHDCCRRCLLSLNPPRPGEWRGHLCPRLDEIGSNSWNFGVSVFFLGTTRHAHTHTHSGYYSLLMTHFLYIASYEKRGLQQKKEEETSLSQRRFGYDEEPNYNRKIHHHNMSNQDYSFAS